MHSLCFRDFDNSDPKDFSKRNSSRPPGVLLFLVLRLLTKSLRHLVESRICALLAPDLYARFEFLRMTVHVPCTSLFALLAKGSFVLSLLSFGTETDPDNALLVFCVHTLHHSTEEKQLKLILTFTVPSTHNEIHSFIHENTITGNCKQCPHHALGQFSSVIFKSENGYNYNQNKN
jgi:hypothetical protein